MININWTYLLFLLFATGCTQGPRKSMHNSPIQSAKKANTQAAMLKLEVVPTHEKTALGAPIPARITLTNTGEAPVLINQRLSMGYENSMMRELYCKVSRDGKPYTAWQSWQVDYNRKALRDTDFVTLKSGESVEREVDLQEWYHLDAPGEYQFEVCYAPEREENDDLPDLPPVCGSTSIVIE